MPLDVHEVEESSSSLRTAPRALRAHLGTDDKQRIDLPHQSLVQRLIDAFRERSDVRPSIMRNQEWDTTLAKLNALDLAQLVLGLLAGDAVHSEATLGVVDEAEVLASLLNGDDILEASGVGSVGADLAINLDQALHDNGLDLACVERILETVRLLAACSAGVR